MRSARRRDKLTPTAEKMRRLMHYGQMFQSHALHFFHLCSPDLLFGFDADPAMRNVIGVARKYPDLAKQGVLMRKFGQEVIKATAGKKIHGTGAIPGGMNKNLSIAERDALLKDVDQMVEWSRRGGEDRQGLHRREPRPRQGLRLVRLQPPVARPRGRRDGPLPRRLRAIDKDGDIDLRPRDNHEATSTTSPRRCGLVVHEVPVHPSIGPRTAGTASARWRASTLRLHRHARGRGRAQEFMAVTDNKPNNLTHGLPLGADDRAAAQHAEKIARAAQRPGSAGHRPRLTKGERRDEAVGILEAPRGTLFHHYKVDENDQVTMCNLIVSTTSNNEPMNRAVRGVADREFISGKEITEGHAQPRRGRRSGPTTRA
jgi:NAD-reducing hydrogenase large subunit